MLIFAAILISLLAPLVVMALSFSRLRSGLLWLVTIASAFLVWLLVFLMKNQLPFEVFLPGWPIYNLRLSPPGLLVDRISWPFALAVATLPFATLLVDVVNIRELDPQVWASNLALGGVGLIAVVAGNPLTLLLAWAVVDVAESAVLLYRMRSSSDRERVVITFSIRVAGMFLLLVAMLRAWSLDLVFDFTAIPVEVSGFLLLAAGLRLGILPTNQTTLKESIQRRGLGTLMRFVPVATSVVFIVRVATVGVAKFWITPFMILSAIAAISGSVAWVRSKDELEGRPYWIVCFTALCVMSATYKLPVAGLVWGLALLFSGSVLFFYIRHQRFVFGFLLLGFLGFSALPFTPAWDGVVLLDAIPWVYRIVVIFALALLFVGYLQFARSSHAMQVQEHLERWMWIVYPLGLGSLLFTYFGLIYSQWGWDFRVISFQSSGWWYGFVPLGLAALLVIWEQRRTPSMSPNLIKTGEIINFNWIYILVWRIYRLFGRLIQLFSLLLEGDGGILWALLILILLVVSLSFGLSGGGFEF